MSRINIICIAGMHRSGTSLTASWLERCGLTIHDGNVWGPNPSNPKGHFEDKEFVALHAKAIRKAVPKSKGWQVEKFQPLYFDRDYLLKAENIVARRSQKYDMWGWKDPRTVLLMESWKNIIPDMKVVAIWRTGHEVVQSLINRSKYSNDWLVKIGWIKAVRNWKNYNRLISLYKKKHYSDSLLFPLKQIIENDKVVLKSINEKFKSNLSYTPIREVYESEILKTKRPNTFSKFLCSIMKVSPVENTLRSLSDL